MSKRFQTFWQIKWKHFECRKKGVESSDIVSESLIFFKFGMEFLGHLCRNFSVEILTVENITLFNVEKILS